MIYGEFPLTLVYVILFIDFSYFVLMRRVNIPPSPHLNMCISAHIIETTHIYSTPPIS